VDIFKLIVKEKQRQIEGIELIASENYVSVDVLKALGSILTNKYSEGYIGKRYYKGNEFIDQIELEAIQLAKKLFGAEHANIQAYSGSPANLAVHFALLNQGDTTMGMSLDSGGHLTHGFKVSFSGKLYNSIQYGLDENGIIDYANVEKLALEHKPKLIWAGASAYSRVIDFKKFSEIAKKTGAILVADISHISGLVVAGIHPSPFPYADIVTTTTHKTLRGPRGAIIMCKQEYAERIDKAIFPGLQGGPHNQTTAAIAVALQEASTEKFKIYAKQILINAKTLSNELQKLGIKVISGGTDNHLMLLDVTSIDTQLGGEEASNILESVNITVNKNAIPNDTRKPWDPSGIRIGTPAITTRGLKENDMKVIAKFIYEALINRSSKEILGKIKNEVNQFISPFPIPGINS
jgi:glycine hydroxymethyltransferase